MKSIELNIEKALGTVSKSDVFALEDKAKSGMEMLHKGTGKGNDFLGWLHLPSEITEAHLADLETAAKQLKDRCEIVVVIGIGGSYLGAKAVIEALSDSFEFLRSEHKNPLVLFAGHNIGEDYLFELQTLLKNKSFGIVVISKSGTTTEPAIAFRLLKEQLEAQVGKDEAKHRIIAITDAKKGALRKLCHCRQRRRPFLGTHSRRTIAYCHSRIRHQNAGFRSGSYGKSVWRRYSFREKPRSYLCCHPKCFISKREENRNPRQLQS